MHFLCLVFFLFCSWETVLNSGCKFRDRESSYNFYRRISTVVCKSSAVRERISILAPKIGPQFHLFRIVCRGLVTAHFNCLLAASSLRGWCEAAQRQVRVLACVKEVAAWTRTNRLRLNIVNILVPCNAPLYHVSFKLTWHFVFKNASTV